MVSTVTVKGQYVDKDENNSMIRCLAVNVAVEAGVSQSIAISYYGKPSFLHFFLAILSES
jgi:hypothetical protein